MKGLFDLLMIPLLLLFIIFMLVSCSSEPEDHRHTLVISSFTDTVKLCKKYCAVKGGESIQIEINSSATPMECICEMREPTGQGLTRFWRYGVSL